MKPNTDENGGLATLEAPARAVRKPPVAQPPVHSDWGDEEQKATGFKKWRAPLIVTVLTIAGITYAVRVLSKADGSGARKDNVTIVQLLPPAPPPPPPPPPPPEAMKEEMIKQEEDVEDKPDPTPVVDTAVKGPAAGGLAIAQQRPNGFFSKRSDGGKTKWGGYAKEVSARITDLLRRDPRTRKASARIEVRVWADPATGKMLRVTLGGSTGDSVLDAAIIETLQGAQLQQPPPDGMPMPIVLRVTARRPN